MSNTEPGDRPFNEGWDPGIPAALNLPAGRDRREAERLMAYWQGKLDELGGEVTLAGLDLHRADSREWSNRFLISLDPAIERSQLILYGPQFARLLGLPPTPRTDLPLLRQLPPRWADLFLRGCSDARSEMAPVRLEGEIDRLDGRVEQYRSIFVPVGVRPKALTWFAFGAFNCRVVDRQ